MVEVGTTAIVVFILLIIFIFLYRWADKLDKEDDAKKLWSEYLRAYNEWYAYYYGGVDEQQNNNGWTGNQYP